MSNGYFIYIILYLISPVPTGFAYTHWHLEDGFVKFKKNSLYTLQSPSDLILFIDQGKAADELREIEKQSHELFHQQSLLKEVESGRLDKERIAFYSDPHCRIAQKKLSQFDLYLSSFLRLEAKGIRIEDYIDYEAALPPKQDKPVCKSQFHFSMVTYDHLKGVADRKKLVNISEFGLVNPIPQAENLEEFGHRISVALAKNETSWVLLNLAAVYWRVSGYAYNAVECLRRALHFSPKKHKDLALVSLANILHHSKYSLDAAILMHAALETTSDYDIVYFTLGNIYGSLGQYDLADICYKYVSDLQPSFEAAKLRMHAAKCEMNLAMLLEGDQEALQAQIKVLEEMMVKQQIIEDQHKEEITERSSPLRKYDIYTDIQPSSYERGEKRDKGCKRLVVLMLLKFKLIL